MAVPSSGTLNQKGLAQECLSGTYGSGSISGRICLDNLVNGGQCGSGSETYPTINTSSPSHPNTTVPYEFSEFYGYDKMLHHLLNDLEHLSLILKKYLVVLKLVILLCLLLVQLQ